MKNLGIGHTNSKNTSNQQQSFIKTTLNHGGSLRKKRNGRGTRPLSTKESLHVVFKLRRERLRYRSLRSTTCFRIASHVVKMYAKRFNVKVEQLSIQNDHIHALIRTNKRSQFHHFFRLAAGQIAQRFQKEGLLHRCVTDTPKGQKSLWIHRPFSRVIRGWKTVSIIRNYIQLNEKEALGQIKYQKNRLKGLSSSDWKILWA